MRVTESMRLANHQRYLNEIAGKLDDTQRQLASGRKIERASDDPTAAAVALHYRRDIAYEAQMRRNIESGIAFMNVTEAALEGATETLQRIRELTVQASNDTLSPAERQTIAREVDQLIRHLAQIANTQFGDAYIFSGTATDTPAYSITGDPPTAITYQGDSGLRVRQISREAQVPVNLVGSQVFGTTFDDLIALRDALASGALGPAIEPSLSAIDASLDRVLSARAELGARINRFEAALQQSETTDLNLQQLRSDVEDVDLAQAIVRLSSEEVALQAALGAIGRASSLTLLDYLR
ncbi:MAG: flagellar hook-associated protein FlgL [Chloroflexota bacterium]|jgi:flagellar hook-associated protein 3 FlgL|nr:flagellar hook-associated protein FlgL [Dehalococcoidia bacterium]MDW8046020.1 flagellar hook-associated protein FlgL [Chloroflexota bacterium]